jgi:hypothetical protein
LEKFAPKGKKRKACKFCMVETFFLS